MRRQGAPVATWDQDWSPPPPENPADAPDPQPLLYVADVMEEVGDCEEVMRDSLKRDSPAAKSRSPVLGHPKAMACGRSREKMHSPSSNRSL